MKKGTMKTWIQASLAAACFVLVFSACRDPIQDNVRTQPGNGLLVLTIGSPARTIQPDVVSDDFVHFDLELFRLVNPDDNVTDGTIPDTRDDTWERGDRVELAAGHWYLRVTAFLANAENPYPLPAAIGSARTTINIGSVSQVDIALRPLTGGPGTFAWNLTLDLGVELTDLWVYSVNVDAAGNPDYYLYFHLYDLEATGNISLEAGRYLVVFRLTLDDNSIYRDSFLHIYQNMTSTFKRTFSANHFGTDLLQYLIDSEAGPIIDLPAGDITMSSSITVNSDIILRGHPNGTRLVRQYRHNGDMFIVSGGGSLTMTTANNGSLTLDGGGGEAAGSLVHVAGGSLYIEEGVFLQNNSAPNIGGGGVLVTDGTFTMSGGVIRGNEAFEGGGVAVMGGTFSMSGGTIFGYDADNTEGANSAENGSALYIANGSIAEWGNDSDWTSFVAVFGRNAFDETIQVSSGVLTASTFFANAAALNNALQEGDVKLNHNMTVSNGDIIDIPPNTSLVIAEGFTLTLTEEAEVLIIGELDIAGRVIAGRYSSIMMGESPTPSITINENGLLELNDATLTIETGSLEVADGGGIEGSGTAEIIFMQAWDIPDDADIFFDFHERPLSLPLPFDLISAVFEWHNSRWVQAITTSEELQAALEAAPWSSNVTLRRPLLEPVDNHLSIQNLSTLIIANGASLILSAYTGLSINGTLDIQAGGVLQGETSGEYASSITINTTGGLIQGTGAANRFFGFNADTIPVNGFSSGSFLWEPELEGGAWGRGPIETIWDLQSALTPPTRSNNFTRNTFIISEDITIPADTTLTVRGTNELRATLTISAGGTLALVTGSLFTDTADAVINIEDGGIITGLTDDNSNFFTGIDNTPISGTIEGPMSFVWQQQSSSWREPPLATRITNALAAGGGTVYVTAADVEAYFEPMHLEISDITGVYEATITLVSSDLNETRTIRLGNNSGSMFTVQENVTLVLGQGITLQGNTANVDALMSVSPGGTLEMLPESSITGNNSSDSSYAGGVHVYGDGATFTMRGGEISGNTGWNSGGVAVETDGTFNMLGGTIRRNTSRFNGGGVFVGENGIFRMSGGTIYGREDSDNGNTAPSPNNDGDGAALFVLNNYPHQYGTAQWGSFDNPDGWSGTDFEDTFGISYFNETIEIQNGELIRPSLATRITNALAASGDREIQVFGNETIGPVTLNTNSTDTVFITLVSSDPNETRTIQLASDNLMSMFTVEDNVTLTLGQGITLQGVPDNNHALVEVDGGTLVMEEGATITGNIRPAGNGGGVNVFSGDFIMEGGTITGNQAMEGGGVFVANGTFTMSGGTITGNEATYGAGVSGGFTMSGTARVTTDNDVFVVNNVITIGTGGLSANPTGTVARITPFDYREETPVLSGGVGDLATNHQRFTVTPYNGQEWVIDSVGNLQQSP